MSAEVLIGGGFKNFDLFFNAQRRLTRIFWLHGGGGFKNLIFLSPTAAAAGRLKNTSFVNKNSLSIAISYR